MHAAGHTFHHRIRDRHLLRPTLLDYFNLVFCTQQRSYCTLREYPTLAVSRSERRNAAIQDHSSRFIGPSAVISATTSSYATTTTSPYRVWSAAAHFLSRPTAAFHRIFLQAPTPSGPKILRLPTTHLRGASSTDPRVCNVTRQGDLRAGYFRVQSHLPFIPLPPPLHRFIVLASLRFEFYLFRFDFVVHSVSRCLFFALTFRSALFLTSTNMYVFVSVSYSGLPAIGVARSVFITRVVFFCDGSIFCLPPVLLASCSVTRPQTNRVFFVFFHRFSFPRFATCKTTVVYLPWPVSLRSAPRT